MKSRCFLLEEVLEQPRLVERLLKEKPSEISRILDARAEAPIERILYTGCGDMRLAARAAASWASRCCGLPARALPAIDFRWEHQGLGKNDLVVAASISGRTPRTIEAARYASRAGAKVVLIKDDLTSPLAKEQGHLLVLNTSNLDDLHQQAYAGYARPVPQTKTFLAALLTKMLLSRALSERSSRYLAGEDLSGLDTLLETTLLEDLVGRSERELMPLVAEHLSTSREFCFLGSGPWAALASYGAAKLVEYAIPARAQCLEEFQHLEMFLADGQMGLIILALDQESSHRALEITRAYDLLQCRTLVIGPPENYLGNLTRHFILPALPMAASLLMVSIPLQLLALQVAILRGRDVNAWVGGQRKDLIFRMSQAVVRGSRIRE
jgi:glucosamine 6-phosphate synthetase-like amidotransferase/phosphosugar isomerase protein